MRSAAPGVIEVVAASAEEAVAQAAAALGCGPAELRVVGRQDVPRLPWQPRRQRFHLARLDTDAANRDGSWEVQFRDGKVWLTVHPPRGSGSPVMPEELLAARRSWPAAHVERERLLAVAEAALGAPELVGAYPVLTDQRVGVCVSPNAMAAYLVLGPPDQGRPITAEEAQAALEAAGVTHGIDPALIAAALQQAAPGIAYLAARGQEPIPGEDAQLMERAVEAGPRIREDGSVDYYAYQLETPVRVGEAVVTKRPPTPGAPGQTVLGEPLAPRPGRDIELARLAGKGVQVSGDGLQLLATVGGVPARVRGRYTVQEVLRVSGDVDLTTGSIDFPGSVIVEGDVEDKLEVRAEADVLVKGVVQGAHIEAGGSVVLANGMFGRGQGRVSAQGGSVRAKFVTESTIHAEEDVTVDGEVLRSIVTAGGSVTVGGRGRIIGGIITAGREVSANVIGSPAGIETRIILRAHAPGETGDGAEAEQPPQAASPVLRVRQCIYPPTHLDINGAHRRIDVPTPYCRYTERDGQVLFSSYA